MNVSTEPCRQQCRYLYIPAIVHTTPHPQVLYIYFGAVMNSQQTDRIEVLMVVEEEEIEGDSLRWCWVVQKVPLSMGLPGQQVAALVCCKSTAVEYAQAVTAYAAACMPICLVKHIE